MVGTGSSSKKPFVEIATLGDDDAGKTTLTAAILKVLSKEKKARPIDFEQLLRPPKGVVNVSYESKKRMYGQTKFSTHVDCVRSLLDGSLRLQGAILVVNVVDPLLPRSRAELELAAQLRIPGLVVFLNKSDFGEELSRIAEAKVRDELERHHYSGAKTRVIRGAAQPARHGDAKWEASIIELLDALDSEIPEPPPEADQSFLMPIYDVQETRDGGRVAIGRIERGVIKPNQEVEIVGLQETKRATVAVLARAGAYRTPLVIPEGRPDEEVQCLLRGSGTEDIRVGQVLAVPGSIQSHRKLEGVVYAPLRGEGGNGRPIASNVRLSILFHRTTDVQGTVSLPDDSSLSPGHDSTMTIEIVSPVALEIGTRFALRDGGKAVGVGVVTKILG